MFNYNIYIYSIILVFILEYTYNYMRNFTNIEIIIIVQLYEYLYLGILTNIRVDILSIQLLKLFDTYNYMSINTSVYLQL